MTIVDFCRDQLCEHGPLPLQTLVELAVDAGKTTARDPAVAVRSAIARTEIQLADQRWATPMWLLEGRIVTVRQQVTVDDWPTAEVDSFGDALWDLGLFQLGPDLSACDDDVDHDLALLDAAARRRPLPLADGGLLHGKRYDRSRRAPRGWPRVALTRDQLLGLRIRNGQVHVEVVPVTEELHHAGELLAEQLGPLDAPAGYWSTEDSVVSSNLVTALWNRMASDPAFLTSPVPPLSQCVPPLVSAVRTVRERRSAEASRWRPQLDLPAHLQEVAREAAARRGQRLDEWLDAFASQSLGALDEHHAGDGEVIPLQRRWR